MSLFGLLDVDEKEISMHIDKQVEDMIDLYNKKLANPGDFGLLKGYNDAFEEQSDSMKRYLDEVSKAPKGTKAATASVEGYTKSLEANAKAQRTAALGQKALNIATNMLASMAIGAAISFIIKGIDDAIHHTDNLIQAGKEAAETIAGIREGYKSAAETVDNVAEKYAKLAQGIDQATGKNKSLSMDEYSKFLDISNQLAELFPTLVRGYDSNGNAILSLNGGVQTITSSLMKLLETERELANYNIVQNLPAQFEGVAAEVGRSKRAVENAVSSIKLDFGTVESVTAEQAMEYGEALSQKLQEAGYHAIVDTGTAGNTRRNRNAANSRSIAPEQYQPIAGTSTVEDGRRKGTLTIHDITESGRRRRNAANSRSIAPEQSGPIVDPQEILAIAEGYIDSSDRVISIVDAEQKKIKQSWSSLNSSLFSWLSTDSEYQIQSDGIQSAIQAMVSGIQWDEVGVDSFEGAQKYIRDNVLSMFQGIEGDPELSLDLTNLINMDTSEISDKELISQWDGMIERIKEALNLGDDDPLIGFLKAFTSAERDAFDRLDAAEAGLIERFGDDAGDITGFISELSDAGDIELFLDIMNKGEYGSFSELTAAFRKAKAELEDGINIEVATENLTKTKDALSLVTKALQEQSTGASITTETFEELIKANDRFAGCLENSGGYLQLNADKVEALTEALVENQRAELESMRAAAADKYISLNREIENLTSGYSSLTDEEKENLQIKKERLGALSEEIKWYSVAISEMDGLTSAYQRWKNAQNTPESGTIYEDARKALETIDDVLNDSTSDIYGKTGRQDFKAAVDFVVGDIDMSDSAAWDKAIATAQRYLAEGGQGAGSFLSDMMAKGFIDENFQIAEGTTLEQIRSELVDGLTLSEDLVRAIFGELEEYDFRTEWTSDEDTMNLQRATELVNGAEASVEELTRLYGSESEAVKAANAELERANEILRQQRGITKDNVASWFGVQDEIAKAEAEIQSFLDKGSEDGGALVTEADRAAYEAAKQRLTELLALKEQLSEPTQAEIQVAYDELGAEISEKKIELETTVDPEARAELEAQIKELETQQLTLFYRLEAAPVELPEEGTQGQMEYVEDWFAQVYTLQVDTSAANLALEATAQKADAVKQKLIEIQNLSAAGGDSGGGGGGDSGGSGAGGSFGVAAARGSVDLNGGRTLVGELGREMVVNPYTGSWRTVGDNGAEFVNIPKGAIVFSHWQTENLLGSGKAFSRGLALAGGNYISGGGNLDNLKYLMALLNLGSATGSASPLTSGSDYDTELKELEHLLKMKLISYTEYTSELVRLEEKYRSTLKTDTDKWYGAIEGIFDAEMKLYDVRDARIEHAIGLLDEYYAQAEDNRDYQGMENSLGSQAEAYLKRMEMASAEADRLRALGVAENDEAIAALQDDWWDAYNEHQKVLEKQYQNGLDVLDDYIKGCNDLSNWGADSEIDALKRKERYIEDSYRHGLITKKKYTEDMLELTLDMYEAELDRYKAYTDAAMEVLEKQRDELEDQKSDAETAVSTITKFIDDRIDALRDENDELSEQLELQQALEALELAKSQRNKRIYREGEGFVWAADEKAVSEAQEAYDKILKDNELEKQIEALEDYKKLWEDAVDSYEKGINDQITAELLGADWQAYILDRKTDKIEGFAKRYEEINNQLNEDVQGSVASQINSLQELIDAIEDNTDKYTGLLDFTKEFEAANFEERSRMLSEFVSSSKAQLEALRLAYQELSGEAPTAGGGTGGYRADYAADMANASSLEEVLALGAERDKKIEDLDISLRENGWAETQAIIDEWKKAHGYSRGGVVDYTGMAMVHGGKGFEEVVFNSSDASKLYKLVNNTPDLVRSMLDRTFGGWRAQPAGISPRQPQAEPSIVIGDIVLRGVQDESKLARALVDKFPARLRQEMYKQR